MRPNSRRSTSQHSSLIASTVAKAAPAAAAAAATIALPTPQLHPTHPSNLLNPLSTLRKRINSHSSSTGIVTVLQSTSTSTNNQPHSQLTTTDPLSHSAKTSPTTKSRDNNSNAMRISCPTETAWQALQQINDIQFWNNRSELNNSEKCRAKFHTRIPVKKSNQSSNIFIRYAQHTTTTSLFQAPSHSQSHLINSRPSSAIPQKNVGNAGKMTSSLLNPATLTQTIEQSDAKEITQLADLLFLRDFNKNYIVQVTKTSRRPSTQNIRSAQQAQLKKFLDSEEIQVYEKPTSLALNKTSLSLVQQNVMHDAANTSTDDTDSNQKLNKYAEAHHVINMKPNYPQIGTTSSPIPYNNSMIASKIRSFKGSPLRKQKATIDLRSSQTKTSDDVLLGNKQQQQITSEPFCLDASQVQQTVDHANINTSQVPLQLEIRAQQKGIFKVYARSRVKSMADIYSSTKESITPWPCEEVIPHKVQNGKQTIDNCQEKKFNERCESAINTSPEKAEYGVSPWENDQKNEEFPNQLENHDTDQVDEKSRQMNEDDPESNDMIALYRRSVTDRFKSRATKSNRNQDAGENADENQMGTSIEGTKKGFRVTIIEIKSKNIKSNQEVGVDTKAPSYILQQIKQDILSRRHTLDQSTIISDAYIRQQQEQQAASRKFRNSHTTNMFMTEPVNELKTGSSSQNEQAVQQLTQLREGSNQQDSLIQLSQHQQQPQELNVQAISMIQQQQQSMFSIQSPQQQVQPQVDMRSRYVQQKQSQVIKKKSIKSKKQELILSRIKGIDTTSSCEVRDYCFKNLRKSSLDSSRIRRQSEEKPAYSTINHLNTYNGIHCKTVLLASSAQTTSDQMMILQQQLQQRRSRAGKSLQSWGSFKNISAFNQSEQSKKNEDQTTTTIIAGNTLI